MGDKHEKITKEILVGMKIGERYSGNIAIKDYNDVTAKTGSHYMKGVLTSGLEVPFIAWSSSSAYQVLNKYKDEYRNKVVFANFEVIDFAGRPTPSLSTISLIEDGDYNDFIVEVYNRELYIKKFKNLMQNILSEKGYSLWSDIMQIDDFEQGEESTLFELFSVAYAAKSHHDNCRTGLLAHTYRMLGLANFLQSVYGWFGKKVSVDETGGESDSDIIYLSIALHDIGKVFEMTEGVYQKYSYVTHRVLGIEMLMPYEERFVELYGLHGWNMLLSVISQHHGEYGEKPKTVYSYVVNRIDELEANMTTIGYLLENGMTESTAGKSIKMNDYTLYIE